MDAKAMLAAAFEKKLAVVKAALAAGIDVNAREEDWGWTAMHYAAMRNQAELFALLLTQGAKVARCVHRDAASRGRRSHDQG